VPGSSTCTIHFLSHHHHGCDQKLAVAMHFFMACLLDVARHLDDLENQNRNKINKIGSWPIPIILTVVRRLRPIPHIEQFHILKFPSSLLQDPHILAPIVEPKSLGLIGKSIFDPVRVSNTIGDSFVSTPTAPLVKAIADTRLTTSSTLLSWTTSPPVARRS
jgi:hypothetical protein